MKLAGVRHPKDGMPVFMYWHKARNTPKRYDPAFQKVGCYLRSVRVCRGLTFSSVS